MSSIAKLGMALGLKFGPVRKGVTPRRVLEYVLNDMVLVSADFKMASDPETISRCNGMLEAYKDVAHFIAPYTDITSGAVRAARGSARAAKAANAAAKVATTVASNGR